MEQEGEMFRGGNSRTDLSEYLTNDPAFKLAGPNGASSSIIVIVLPSANCGCCEYS